MGARHKDSTTYRVAEWWSTKPEGFVANEGRIAHEADQEGNVQSACANLVHKVGALRLVQPCTYRLVDKEALELYLMGVEYNGTHRPVPRPQVKDVTTTRCQVCWEDLRTCEINGDCR